MILEGKLEPEAADARTSEQAALTSLAVSMKRIADALVPVAGQDVGSTLFYIEQALRSGR